MAQCYTEYCVSLFCVWQGRDGEHLFMICRKRSKNYQESQHWKADCVYSLTLDTKEGSK